MGQGGKVFYRRGGSGGGRGGWRRGRARARRGSGTDDASDEEYVVGEDEVGAGESSYDSYSSDASREASQDAEDTTACSEEDGDGRGDEEDAAAARWRRPRKGPAGSRREPAARPLRRGEPAVAVADEDEGMETPLTRKPGARQRRRPGILAAAAEEDEYEDDDDEDFAPDEDEDDEEEFARGRVRRAGGGKSRPVKRKRRKGRPRSSKVKEMGEKARVSKRRRRMAPISDHDDFVVEDRVSIDGTERKRRISGGRKRTPRAWCSDPSETDSSDFDFTISEEESKDLPIGGPSSHRERIPLSGGVHGEEKGKGKEIDDLGKQVCGICLSEEHNHVIRGLLDCCAHYFCFPCIMEWSKVESRCPVCKRRFKAVSKSARLDAGCGLRTAIIRIPKRDQVYQPSEEEVRGYLDPYASVVCTECQQGGDDNLMLLCDICDSSAHTYCVGLGREVPEGNWYCDVCRSTDPGSLNSRVQELAVEHRINNQDMSQEDSSGGVDDIAMHRSLGFPQQSLSLRCPPHSEGISQGTYIRCQSSVEDSGTTSCVSGFAASTVSGRRTIRQRIRIILSNNRVRWISGVARNDVIQHSTLESDHCNSQFEQNGETCHAPQDSLINGVNERSNRSLLRPRVGMHPCQNEGSNYHLMGGAKKQVKSIVKNLLSHLTRDTSLGRRDFKEIARHATHTILAACGFPYRRSMVTLMVQVPSNCVHLAEGELGSVVKDCCSSCFTAFVGNVVQENLNLKLRSTGSHA